MSYEKDVGAGEVRANERGAASKVAAREREKETAHEADTKQTPVEARLPGMTNLFHLQKICDSCSKFFRRGGYYCKNCAGYICAKCGKPGLCPTCAPKLTRV